MRRLTLKKKARNWPSIMPIRDWNAALNRFTIQFEDCMTHH